MPGVCSSILSSTDIILETMNEEDIQPINVTSTTTNKKPRPGMVRKDPSGAVIHLGNTLYNISGRKLSTTLNSHITTYKVMPSGAIKITPWKKYWKILWKVNFSK